VLLLQEELTKAKAMLKGKMYRQALHGFLSWDLPSFFTTSLELGGLQAANF
jgi:hypothetical protein